MAVESNKTAGSVHASSYSIVAIVAGLVVAIVVVVTMLFIFYDGQNVIDEPATLSNSTKTSEPVTRSPR